MMSNGFNGHIIVDAHGSPYRSCGTIYRAGKRRCQELAKQETFAGAHLGANWTARSITESERIALNVSNDERLK